MLRRTARLPLLSRPKLIALANASQNGYGYTAGGGRTFPFRGRGVGLMPSLAELLDAFPERRFLVNVKSNDPEEGERLAAALAARPAEQVGRVIVYGAIAPARIAQRY